MTLTAMLMAGGESRRMGRDKATMVFEGEMMWQRQLRLLQSLKPQELCVSARVRPAWCPAGVESVLDAAPGCGPLSGIAAGLSQLRTSHLLVLALDMPRISLEHLHKLAALAVAGVGVVPRKAVLFEPLCAVYPAEAAVPATNALARGEASLQHLIRDLFALGQLQAYELSEAEIPLYRNLNTPGD
ncbi:MAG: molybdenum cofactor guanylyltransferase [Limisphaerales bacterium]